MVAKGRIAGQVMDTKTGGTASLVTRKNNNPNNLKNRRKNNDNICS